MSKLFYTRLAFTNLRKNKSTYFPYLLSSVVIISMFYIIQSLYYAATDAEFYGAGTMGSVLELGSYVVGLFAVLLLFYTNGFLIKRRKKELGLYSILGMEKRHIACLLLCETLLTTLISLLLGLALGLLLSKLMFLLLNNITQFSIQIAFQISLPPMLNTILLFLVIFLLTLLYNLRHIHISNPITLLQSSRQGEKEPKTKWPLALFGLLCIAGGYTITLLVQTPFEAVTLFFAAVILVILGTYSLFTAGSIALLKFLRSRKKFYYNPRNFISVSGMIYRMKQNAAGLASICILSTAVLVILSSTVSLYAGQQEILDHRYPRDIVTHSAYREGIERNAQQAANETAKLHSLKIRNAVSYRSLSFVAAQEGAVMNPEPKEGSTSPSQIYEVVLFPLEDYNRATGQALTLLPGEVFLYAKLSPWKESSIQLGNQTLAVRGSLPEAAPIQSSQLSQVIQVAVPDLNTLQTILADFSSAETIRYTYDFDLEGPEEGLRAFCSDFPNAMANAGCDLIQADNVYDGQQDFLTTFGTLFFIGIFLGVLFTMATVLIIYYKQVSEGYDDRERFDIMQKVGLNRQEVKKTIHKQILLVFFLPLLTAVVHIAVAFHVISKLLMAFGLLNTNLFFLCTLGTVLVFALAYVLVYAMTAKTYYRLVQRKS